jgi:3-oxoadipate enol-lactonase
MPLLTTKETTIYYQYDAVPQRPVLMLSNSLGTDLSMWDSQVAKFTEHFSLLRYDTRGHGQSSGSPGPCTMEQLGRDVLTLLDGLELSRVHFCGLSMGGMVGQWLGVNAPERLISLVLADTAAKCGDEGFWNRHIQTALRDGMSAVVPGFVGDWFTETFRARQPDQVERIAAVFRSVSPKGFAACCAAIRDMDQRADVAKICTPTLVAYGKFDPATTPSDAKFLLDAIAGAEELQLEAAHLTNIESPDEFTKGVTDFLLRHR